VVTQARLDIEEIGGGKANIVVTELPYAVQKSTVIDKIAREVGSGRIQGVSDLRDESDYTGMRLVIEVMRGYEPRQVMEQLLTYSQFRETFGVISRALVVDEEGEVKPEMLSLHQMLEQFIQHRLTVIIRRSRYELAKREARLHIIEGLLKALDMVDAVVAAIRKSKSRETARQDLQKKPFNFSEEQAKAIVALPLGNLASLEIRTLKEEGRDVWNRIKVLKGLLAEESQRLQVVIDETAALQKAFATPRRTVILDRAEQAAGVAVTVAADLARPAVTQTVAITTQGVLRSDSASFAYRVKEGPSGRAVEAHLAQFQLEPDDSLLLVSSAGRAWRARVGQVATKAAFADLGLGKGEVIVGGGVLQPDGLVVIGTRQGKIKRVRVAELGLSEASWAMLMGLDKGDEALFAGVASDAATVLFFTSGGKAVHFPANLVNPQSTPSAKGVGGIKIGKGDRVIAGAVVEPDEAAQALIVSQTGYVKRAPLAEFPLKGRDTQGVQSLDLTKATGPVAAATVTGPGAKFVDVLSAKGWRWRLPLASVPVADRRKRGDRLAPFEDDAIVRVAALAD
jgi:DNA gyrase subunit A